MSSLKYPLSDHFDGLKFRNLGTSGQINKSFGDLWRWMRTRQKAEWPKWVADNVQPTPALQTQGDEIHLTFINHVTFLIQTNGLNILTDPVFSKRASPFQWAGPQRVRAPGIELGQLPRIDVVLVSHNHYDHMDLHSLKALRQKFRPRFLAPLGNGRLMRGFAGEETDWWDTTAIANGTDVITVPAQHWSGRKLTDRNLALWAGFIVTTPTRKIFFAGDTGYGSHFKQIRERCGDIDISLLPIGAYEPRWFMKEQHMNPEEAVQAHMDLHSRLSIGTHFGTFQLTDEAIDAPLNELSAARKKLNVESFITLAHGETRKF